MVVRPREDRGPEGEARLTIKMRDAVGELLISFIVAVLFWPGLDPAYWHRYPDNLAPAIALALELAAFVGVAHAVTVLLT